MDYRQGKDRHCFIMGFGNFLWTIPYVFLDIFYIFTFSEAVMAKKFIRVLVSALVLTALALSIAAPVYAFEGRGGDAVTIGKNGRARAEVHGKLITVEGEVDGNLFGQEQIVIRNSGSGTRKAVSGEK